MLYPITTFHRSYPAPSYQPHIIAYSSIPKPTNKAPIRPVPPTTTLPPAPLELEADAEVVLAVPVAALLVVVVIIVLFGKMPAGVEVVEVVLTVMRLADTVVVEAEVIGPTWLTCTVTDVLATVVVEIASLPVEELAERPEMLK